MQLEPLDAATGDLLLDPNNHRFHDIPGYKPVNEARYHEPKVQDKAFILLRDTPSFELEELKNSIRTNGYVPLEQVVVSRYGSEDGKYTVVEGNRRIAAVKWLLEDQETGAATLKPQDITRLNNLPLLLLDSGIEGNADAAQVLMAIRHVSGVKEWGAYQQARLVVDLRDRHGSLGPVADMLGMTAKEVARRYRASKALAQMEEDEEYGSLAETSHYAIYHEVVAIPQVRQWLGWDDKGYEFKNKTNLAQFYSLLTDTDPEYLHLPKIRSYADVRKMRTILSNPEATEALFDPARPLEDAYHIATKASRVMSETAQLEEAVHSASAVIGGLSAPTLIDLTDKHVKALKHLNGLIEGQLANRNKLLS